MNLRCDCERGGNCSKTSVCALTNMEEEYDEILDTISDLVDRVEAILRNDLYKNRIKNALAEIEEIKCVLGGRP